MIDKSEVLGIINSRKKYSKEMEFECCAEECDILKKEINKLPEYPKETDLLEYIENLINKFKKQQDTELLKECYEILTGETQVMTDELMKHRIELFFKLKERLDIK